MTLLVNEIHVRGSLQNGLILQAADRRITVEGKFHSNRKKLFNIPHLNAGVGHFGLAQVNEREFFSSWLPNFIRHACKTEAIEEFARRLMRELNEKVNKTLLARNPSGFHICGYNSDDYPELWFVRNIGGMEGPVYKGFQAEYFISEDFLARDACNMGFDGTDPRVPADFNQYYVNGDIRPFHSIWRRLDGFLAEMFSHPGFRRPHKPSDLEKIAKWKMHVISSFYKQFAERQIIGTPIDAFVLVPEGAA